MIEEFSLRGLDAVDGNLDATEIIGCDGPAGRLNDPGHQPALRNDDAGADFRDRRLRGLDRGRESSLGLACLFEMFR